MEGVSASFAVKRVKVTSTDVLQFCTREFEVLQRLHHPNIIHAYRLLLEEQTTTSNLFLEFIDGKSLRELLDERYTFTGEIYAEEEVRSVARQLFSALALLQQKGLAHRDINPGNLLLSNGVLTLIDFQTACDLSNCRGLVGTSPFQAPEMWSGNLYDCKVDVWSAGAVLSRLLRGTACSAQCTEFLTFCTETNSHDRVSALQALTHPWLQ